MKKHPGKKTSPVDTGRRRLMAGAIGIGAAAGLGLTSLSSQAQPAEQIKPTEKGTKYHETEHIRRYYRRAQEV